MKPLGHDAALGDVDAVALAIQAAGLDPRASRDKALLVRRAAEALEAAGTERNLAAFFVPGRVEVLGKHTDYAGGRSMVIAAEQGFAVVVRPRDDRQIIVRAVDLGESADFVFDGDLIPRAGHWSNYPMTVARRLARNFPGGLRGAKIALAADLPPAAGMSSSSAMVVAMFLALDAVNHLAARPEYRANISTTVDLAGYLGTVENGRTFGSLVGDRGVGTFGGSEDHTAILCGTAGCVNQYSYCPVRFERAVPLPSTHRLAIAASGVVAEKTGNALARYNAASRRAAVAAELWRGATGRDDPHLAAIANSSPEAVEQLRKIVLISSHEQFNAESLLTRFDQFITESEQIIPRAGDALAGGDLEAFGTEVDRSQQAAERLLGNQVPETIHLAACARRLGAAAASAFGAGFGGSVWALVEASRMDAFLADWQVAYHRQFPQHAAAARFFSTTAGPAAFRIR
ncbi:MAG TPA: galactokinase family protein [Thermoguttaceae bacterium]|nr:galactokinase family protein [Thermoguttaceae bacterium]